MNRIVWLASYPKSGNTWFRALLSNLCYGGDEPVSINAFSEIKIASARTLLDDWIGTASSDLTHEEAEALRPDAYRAMARVARDAILFKVHDAFGLTRTGEPLFPPDVTLGALYVVRNPLDVAVSYAYHRTEPLDAIIARMNAEDTMLCNLTYGLSNQVRQKLGSWSQHVASWVDQTHLPVHAIRYEDMKRSPLDTFRGALDFLGWNYPEERIARAVAFSSFGVLQSQESREAFRERNARSAHAFFRRGEAGAWRDELTQEQVHRLLEAHGPVMDRFGYLSSAA